MRVKIAEAAGWKRVGKPYFEDGMEEMRAMGMLAFNREFWLDSMLPDFPADLNAMHEAENVISDEIFHEYIRVLQAMFLEITKGRTYIGAHSATASQRAEAFLRALSLWED